MSLLIYQDARPWARAIKQKVASREMPPWYADKAVYPDGRQEIILRVPNYNFNWQLTYQLKEPTLLPKGTTLVGIAHFDNSANNKANPDPTRDVRWGDQTWEEMMIAWYKTVSAADATDGTTGNQQ